jgi:hypothetical protein
MRRNGVNILARDQGTLTIRSVILSHVGGRVYVDSRLASDAIGCGNTEMRNYRPAALSLSSRA